MRKTVFLLPFFWLGCTAPVKKNNTVISNATNTTTIQNTDINAAAKDTLPSIHLPVIKKLKNPIGIYQTILPLNSNIEQTVAFNEDLTYQLQEKYIGEKDSLVVTKGTWIPSDGYVWLYKDQVVRGRYKWKGNTLQYYSPLLKKNFSMNHLQDAMENEAQNKSKEGAIAFGTGTEPFWKFEFDNKDSLSFLLSDWQQPVKMKISSSFLSDDSTGYVAQNDSAHIRVTIFPHFCKDGMSDLTYRNKVRVQYNQQVYNGCGIIYKQ